MQIKNAIDKIPGGLMLAPLRSIPPVISAAKKVGNRDMSPPGLLAVERVRRRLPLSRQVRPGYSRRARKGIGSTP